MEKGRNSYYGLAKSNYMQALNTVSYAKEYNDYNAIASLCAQSCEKFLKAYLEIHSYGTVMGYMRSHNLRVLINEALKIDPSIPLDVKDYKWVGDFYFDARYPGDDFVEVSEKDAEECLRLTKELMDWIDSVDNEKDFSDLEKLDEF